jgi:UPF0716 protein FxsA
MWPFLLLVAVPVVEIALFITVGGWIGVWPTIGLVLLAAFAGMALVRSYGTRTLAAVQAAMRRGEDPGEQIFGAAMMLIAAGLFITPGFLTDAMALALLVPGIRSAIYRAVRGRMRLQTTILGGFGPAAEPMPQDRVIDGDFTDVTPGKRPTHPPSGWTRH